MDPARLQGAELDRWYRRTPGELQQQKQEADFGRWDNFVRSIHNSKTSAQWEHSEVEPGGLLIRVGNPANERLKKEWEQREGRPWPRDPVTGRPYDVAHKKAVADGGTNTLDNVEPLHPNDHRAAHAANRDHARWGRRPGIARAFGGRVAKVLGPLGVLYNITGLLSGRIRTDTQDNFLSDMFGIPSQEDIRRREDDIRQQMFPDSKPGDLVV